MRDYDTWKTTPPEPDVVGDCLHCGAELYANCEYTHDRNEDEWYCDADCFLSRLLDIGEVVTEVKSHDA